MVNASAMFSDDENKPHIEEVVSFDKTDTKELEALLNYQSVTDNLDPSIRVSSGDLSHANFRRSREECIVQLRELIDQKNSEELVMYMQSIEGPQVVEVPVERKKTRVELEKPNPKNGYGFVWAFRPKKQFERTTTFTEMVKQEKPRTDYTREDVQRLVCDRINNLESACSILERLEGEIDHSVDRLLRTGHQYNESIAKANQGYVAATESIVKLRKSIDEHSERIDSLSGTSDERWKLQNQRDTLEVRLSTALGDEKICAEVSQLKEGYSQVLNVYRAILSQTREDARDWRIYLNSAIQCVKDVCDINNSVYDVCKCVTDSYGALSQIADHLTVLTNATTNVHKVMKEGFTPNLSPPINLDKVTAQISAARKNDDAYRARLHEQMTKRLAAYKRR